VAASSGSAVPCRTPDLLFSDPFWQGNRTPTCSSTRRGSPPSVCVVHRNAAALPFFFLLFLEFARGGGRPHQRCPSAVAGWSTHARSSVSLRRRQAFLRRRHDRPWSNSELGGMFIKSQSNILHKNQSRSDLGGFIKILRCPSVNCLSPSSSSRPRSAAICHGCPFEPPTPAAAALRCRLAPRRAPHLRACLGESPWRRSRPVPPAGAFNFSACRAARPSGPDSVHHDSVPTCFEKAAMPLEIESRSVGNSALPRRSRICSRGSS
jgi:hypothetical protein